MKKYWQQWAAKLAERSLREQRLILAMVLAVTWGISQILWVDPAMTRHKMLTADLVNQEQQLQAAEAELQGELARAPADPNVALRTQLAEIEKKLALTREALEAMQGNLVSSDKMPRLLQDVLEQNRNIKLVSLKTLPVSNLVARGDQDETIPGQDGGTPAPGPEVPLIYRHGVEIVVSGRYADLLQYLVALEKLPWRMLWGKAQMKVGQWPEASLSITLYTLSTDKTWLSV